MGCKDFKFVKFSSTILVNLSEQKYFFNKIQFTYWQAQRINLKKFYFLVNTVFQYNKKNFSS